MMRFRVLTLTVLVMVCAIRLHASSEPSDPRIVISGGHDSAGQLACMFTCVGLDFSFMADGSGGGIFSFTNNSGQNWTSLEIEAPFPTGDIISCGGSSFATCVVMPQSGDFIIIEFYGGGGILQNQSFTIDLGTSGWLPNGEFQAFANVPESSTLAFCLVGLAPLLRRQRHRFLRRDR
jgi:hypothetical protein